MNFQINDNSYLHTAYSNASDGSVDFTVAENDDATYIGQYIDSSADDSSDPDDYEWEEVDEDDDQEYLEDDTEETEDYDEELVDQLDRTAFDTSQAADGAQEIGGAKIQTYYQDDAPDSDQYGFNTGDLWYDTDDGNHVYRWDGTKWIDAQDTGIAAAQTAADDAATLAYNALATADGKNTVYYQSAEPSGSTYVTNDIWFDNGNGNKMYCWNGTTWTEQTFGTGAISANAITAEKIAAGAITAASIVAGVLQGMSLLGERIDIEAEGDSGAVMIKTKLDDDDEYELDLAVAVGHMQSHLALSAGLINLYGTALRISVDNLELDVPYDSETYDSADDTGSGVVTSCSVTVVKKTGLCFVSGSVTMSGGLTDWINILNATKVSAPQHGVGLYDAALQWGSSYTRPLRIGIGAGGSLRIRYGAAGSYSFVLPPYPIA